MRLGGFGRAGELYEAVRLGDEWATVSKPLFQY